MTPGPTPPLPAGRGALPAAPPPPPTTPPAPPPPPPPPPQTYAGPPGPPVAYYPPPLAYYPPPMYAVPVIVPPPGRKTFEGLKRLKNAAMGSMAYNALIISGGVVAALALPNISAVNPAALAGALASIVLVSLLLLAGAVIGLVTFIWAILGYRDLYDGRHEFGDEHRRSVESSLRWFATACVAYLVSVVAGLIVGFSMVGSATGPAAAARFSTSAAITGGVLLVYVYAAAQVMQAVVAKLMTAQGRGRRQLFIVLSLTGGGLALALNLAAGFLFASAFTTPSGVSGVSAVASIAGALTVATSFLYLKQLGAAEQGARNMIQAGQFNPDAAAGPGAAPAAPGPAV